MEIQERGRPSTASRNVLIIGILGGLSCVLLIVILGIVGSIHYRQSEGTQSASTLSSSQLAELFPLDQRFPGYFLTEEEIEERLAHLSTRSPVTQTINASNTCSFDCVAPFSNFTEEAAAIPSYPIRPGKRISHACCDSQTGLFCPDVLVDKEGVKRTLARFQKKRQCFPNETCKQVEGCMVCTCTINTIFATGVYVDGSSYGIATFMVNGCCKCENKTTSS